MKFLSTEKLKNPLFFWKAFFPPCETEQYLTQIFPPPFFPHNLETFFLKRWGFFSQANWKVPQKWNCTVQSHLFFDANVLLFGYILSPPLALTHRHPAIQHRLWNVAQIFFCSIRKCNESAVCWTLLQHTATHCITLHHTATRHRLWNVALIFFYVAATHCITGHYTATYCITLQHTATHCITPQFTATYCNTLQHITTHCITLQHTATHCNTLQLMQHTTAHCNTLQLNIDSELLRWICSLIFQSGNATSVVMCCSVL